MDIDLTERMTQWRNGELSYSEILTFLVAAQAEVINAMRESETKASEERCKRPGV